MSPWSWTGLAVLSDLDGVLADSIGAVDAAWAWWARRVGIDPDALLTQVHGVRSEETIARVVREQGLVAGDGRPLDLDVEVAVLEAEELARVDQVRPLPGAARFAAAIPSERFAVVTSGSRAIATGRLAAAGVAVPRVFVTAEDVSAGKPDPEGYRAAAAGLGVPPRRCLVLEDTPAGIAAGRGADASVIGIAGSGDRSTLTEADVVVPDPGHLGVEVAADGTLTVTVDRTA